MFSLQLEYLDQNLSELLEPYLKSNIIGILVNKTKDTLSGKRHCSDGFYIAIYYVLALPVGRLEDKFFYFFIRLEDQMKIFNGSRET